MQSIDYLICVTCGTQYNRAEDLTKCHICEDPRQYVPASGQAWTTLRKLRDSKKYKNRIEQDPLDENLYSIWTEPQFAIGQRAILIRSKAGKNILWDCITYLDDATVKRVKDLGGIDAIAISHPHFYSSHIEWAHAFNCPVYISDLDKDFVSRFDDELQKFYTSKKVHLADDITLLRAGGHFPGSAVLNYNDEHLLVADTVGVALSGMGDRDRQPGTISFTFMWSYPNMIPLSPDEVLEIWKTLSSISFNTVHSGWWGKNVTPNAKERVLESAQMFVRAMGYNDHPILKVQR
ncbi:beta-lactamase-like protein [Dipodascopsis uninucleata]